MTHRTEQCCRECSGWEPALHECSCQCHYSPTDESVVSPTIPERVEEFKKEFWKLSGDSVTELDRKQDEYVQNMLTETDQQAREEVAERIEWLDRIAESYLHVEATGTPNDSMKGQIHGFKQAYNIIKTGLIDSPLSLSNPPSQV